MRAINLQVEKKTNDNDNKLVRDMMVGRRMNATNSESIQNTNKDGMGVG